MADKDPYSWTPEFEVAAVRQLVADPSLLPKIAGFVQAGRFPSEQARILVDAAVRLYKDLGDVPTPVMLLQDVRSQVEGGKFKLDKVQECAAFLERGEEQPPAASAFVAEQVTREERKAAMWRAIDTSLRHYKAGDLDLIEETVARANRIGAVDFSPGIDLQAHLALRTAARKSGKVPPRWGTGIPDLDALLEGGLAAGELGVILAGPKFGKSMCLDYISLHVAGLGGTVVFFSLEMGEWSIADRHDAAISRVPINLVQKKADEVDEKVNAWFDHCGGCVIVKQYPSGGASVRDFRAFLQWLRSEKGVVPTLVIVDYGDLVAAASRDFDKRHEELGVIYTELRGLAGEFLVPMWTASQATRESLSAKVVTAQMIGESFKKVQIADVIVALCRTEDERVDRQIRFYLSQCRYAADGVMIGPYPTAFEIGRIVADGTGSGGPVVDAPV